MSRQDPTMAQAVPPPQTPRTPGDPALAPVRVGEVWQHHELKAPSQPHVQYLILLHCLAF